MQHSSERLRLVPALEEPEAASNGSDAAAEKDVLTIAQRNDECVRQILEYMRRHDSHCC